MRVLVTGAGGFSGKHVIEYLATHPSAEIYCTSRTLRNEKHWLFCDLTRRKAASGLIEQVMPDQIYHLVGLHSNNYEAAYRVNVLCTRNLLEAIGKTQRQCRILLVGSSAEYGFVPEADNPVREDHPLSPMSTYGLTKVYQTLLMKFYCSLYNMDIVMARPFNLLGNGAPATLFVGRVFEQIEAFRGGKVAKIVVGSLKHRRDYIPVQQAARYYALIMQRGKTGEIYNVGSGASIAVRELLQHILEENGLSMALVQEQESKLLHRFDIKDLVADISKLKALSDD